MITVHSTLLTRLRDSATDPSIERKPVDLYEFYDSDYIPDPTTGFDPADATETFAAIDITYNGIAYRREVISRGNIDKHKDQQTNSVSVTFSAVSGYLPTWAVANEIEGMWMVIRYAERDITAGSLVLFVGKAGKPSTVNLKTFSISASQESIDINAELPLRNFSPQDPEGRAPTDDLYEGIRLVAVAGSQTTPEIIPAQNRFARLIGQRDTVYVTRNWSSLDATPYGNPIPEVLGRAQLKLIPFFWADKGLFVAYLMAAAAGPIEAIENIKNRTSGFSEPFNLPGPVGPIIHLGDAGGTGTNLGNTNQFQESGKFSHLAYIEGASTGSAADVEDNPPEVTALVIGRKVPTPDGSGVYSSIDVEGDLIWSDNPVDLARWIFIVTGTDEGFLEDTVNYLTRQYCDEAILDDSNSERVFVPDADIPQTGGAIRRYVSTGLLTSRLIRWWLGDPVDAPYIREPGTYEPLDLDNVPGTYVVQRSYRKRYTFNAPIVERVKATDFLYKVLYPAARLFHRINSKGKIEIHTEKPSDNCLLRAATIVGATALLVDDVTQWKEGLLLQGMVNVGFGLTTSENRRVSTATYTTDGNAITLTAGVTGSVTATASGATLSGGSTTVQASGTVTIGGSMTGTVTVTINGIAIVYALVSGESTASVAAMLAVAINADTRLNRYIKATSAGAVLTVKAKYGVLNLSSALANAHTGPRANPVAGPTLAQSAGSMAAGDYLVAYAYVTAVGRTLISPTTSITLLANRKIDTTSLGALPAGVLSVNWYVSEPDTDKLIYYSNNNGTGFSITSLPSRDNPGVPPYNSTGEETIRIALPFATNTQGATVLAQSGLTRANIKTDTFNFPLGSEQSSINQIKGNFRDASSDFALTPFTVRDPAHYARVGKWKPLEVDYSGVDNWNQAFRLANSALSKNREGDWFYTLGTGTGEALLLEEGDIITASDDSGGLINQVTRIESLSISPTWEVTVRKARRYSTLMFSDDVRQHDIPLPSTLRYVQTRASVLGLVNGPPIRDADGQTPGLYAFSGYDDDVSGDHRGSGLYADYGNGDQRLLAFNALATLGVCDTTLATATSPGWDRTSTLDVTLKRGELTSHTEDELKADPRLNLAAIGNKTDGYEYVQFAAVTDNGDGEYTIDGPFLRGAFGTDDSRMTHHASDSFLLFDGAELFVPIDPVRLGEAYDYRAVTTNQDVAEAIGDALIEDFIWDGGTARTLAPTNVKGLRSPQGDLWFRWARQARYGQGLRSFSDVPLGEEVEQYKIEVYSGATLKRSWHTGPGIAQAALWVAEDAYGDVDKNSFEHTGVLPQINTAARSMQQIMGSGSFVEAELDEGADEGREIIGLIRPTEPTGSTALADYSIEVDFASNAVYVRERGGAILASETYEATARYRIMVVGSEVRFYKNYVSTNNPPPFYISRTPPQFPYHAYARVDFNNFGASGSVRKAVISGALPSSTIYSEDEQVADFGSVQNPIKIRVYQVSSVVGPGAYREVNI